jgi:hypothetical protein
MSILVWGGFLFYRAVAILVNPEIVLQISGFYSSIIRTHLADGVACHLMTPVRLHSRP